MGGGDLNLKKSWHPSTLRNIERVWKAEQKHEVEKQKIEQLQKELAEERQREEIIAFAEDHGVVKKKEERLDWMYQGPTALVNRDDYLMGRKIDKTFEVLQQQECGSSQAKENASDIGVTMFSSQDLTGTATVDLANKIREDPLFSIMKKETEQRKNLLTNPVKMKQLQQLLKLSLDKKKSKKSKKDKKKKHHNYSSDDEKLQKQRMAPKKSRKNSTSESEDEINYSKEFYGRGSTSSKVYSSNKHYSSESSDKRYKLSHHSIEVKHRSSTYRSSHREEYMSHEVQRKQSHNHISQTQQKYQDAKRKLDSEERERRLKEMQDNAKWRDDQRQRNSKRYKEEDEKEDRMIKVKTSEFLNPMLSKVAGKGSLENRVRQKIFTIQRSSADMDKHFLRRS